MHDEQHIANLLHRFIETVDQRDFEALGELFKSGCYQFVMPGKTPGKIYEGKDEVQRFLQKILSPIEEGTVGRHIISNLIIDVERGGERAKSRCYSVGLRFKPGSSPIVIGVARYFGEYAKSDGTWHLTKMVNHVDLIG